MNQTKSSTRHSSFNRHDARWTKALIKREHDSVVDHGCLTSRSRNFFSETHVRTLFGSGSNARGELTAALAS